MAKDHQLLLTARDYFQFVANFSEVISVSATHIYHSALELSPLTSIVRKLYYHQQRYPSPRVVIGIEDSWEPTRAIPSNNSHYLSSTWSPCGQFITVMVSEAVEIRDALTLKPISTPQSTKATTVFRSGLAYSPDGYSLAGCSDSAIIIWDTQTGGEVTRITFGATHNGLELTWSKDGKTIAIVSPWNVSPQESGTITIHTYNIVSDTVLFTGTLRSRDKPHLWAHEKSFQIIVTTQDEKGRTFDIFEVGSTLARIESFQSQFDFSLRAFSSTTFRASVSHSGGAYGNSDKLYIFNIHNSEVLLLENQYYFYEAFSPDANLFAASKRYSGGHLRVWKYSSGKYVQWREFQQTLGSLQFSPTSLSILCTFSHNLSILHLDYFPAVLSTEPVRSVHPQLKDAFSPDNTYIATAHQGENTITITNLQYQIPSPSQFIDTELEISTMALTGNVLMVKSPDKIVAWLLTKNGVVDGIIGNTRADCNDSLWELSIPTIVASFAKRGLSVNGNSLSFSVMDGTAIIRLRGFKIHAYHTETGEVIQGGVTHHHDCTLYHFHNEQHVNELNLYHNSLCTQHGATSSKWLISKTALQEGWVRDPEGKHRLWLPPSWRPTNGDVNWLHSATTLRLRIGHHLVFVKF